MTPFLFFSYRLANQYSFSYGLLCVLVSSLSCSTIQLLTRVIVFDLIGTSGTS